MSWWTMFQSYFRAIHERLIRPGVPKPGKWIHPMPIYTDEMGRDFFPKVSSGYHRHKTEKHRQHLAVDIMYRRLRPGKKKYPVWDKNYFCPNNIPFLAAQDGYVWHSKYSSRFGWNVRLDHGWINGIPYNTFSQHMSQLFVPTGIKKGKVPGTNKRFYVKKGEMLGIVGHSPGDHLNHEHFGIWTATPDKSIDPVSILEEAEILRMNDPRIKRPTGQKKRIYPRPEKVTRTALAFGIPAILAVALLAGEIDEYDLATYYGYYDTI